MSSGKWKKNQVPLQIQAVTVSDTPAYLPPYASFLLDEYRKIDWNDPEIDREFKEWMKKREGVGA